MRGRDAPIWFCLGSSLVVHAAMMWAMVRTQVVVPTASLRQRQSQAAVERRVHPDAPAPALAAMLEARRSQLGVADGKGFAINDSQGEDIMHAREGDQDQAWLSRDPIGRGKRAENPESAVANPGRGGGGAPGAPGMARDAVMQVQSGSSTPLGISSPPLESIKVVPGKLPGRVLALLPAPAPPPEQAPVSVAAAADLAPTQRLAATRQVEEVAPTTQPVANVALAITVPVIPAAPQPAKPGAISQSPPVAQPVQAGQGGNNGAGGRPGARGEAADAAPLADSESDAFSRVPSLAFRNGRFEGRLGRKHRFSVPRLTIKAEVDLATLNNPTIVVKVSIDEQGNIVDVDVHRSSGSNELDLVTRKALYKSWIEPAKDASGKPVRDVEVLSFRWR